MYAPLLDIIKTIGLPAAMKLVENFGGTRIYIPLPQNITADHGIAKVIGLEATLALARLWPKEYPSIPLARRHLRIIVKGEILRDKDKLSVPELARKYETTERNIYRYLSETDEPEAGQPGLF
jgi:Mor family transcriptional regulator